MTITAQQFIDDLTWSVTSPSLIYPPSHTAPELDADRIDIGELVRQFVESPHYRVGRHFESLVEFWIRRCRGLKIIEQQRQIFSGTRTLGEIDFIYRNESEEVIHLETAVKFYLHYPGDHRSGSHFIGPNSNDNLEAKHHKLFNHQLKLGREHFENVTRSEAFVKGRIFYHVDSQVPNSLPEMLSEEHLQGRWIYADELDWLDRFEPEVYFEIVRKPHWLSDIRVDQSMHQFTTRNSLKRLAEMHFKDSIRPLLVAHLEQREEHWIEAGRFFIVHTGWPHLENK